MYEDGRIIKIRNQEYFAVFNTAALEEVTRRYGGLKELSDVIIDQSKAIGEIAWLIALLISQGTALKKAQEGIEGRTFTDADIKILMSPKELMEQTDLVIEIINAGMGDEGEAEENAEVDEVLEEIESSKNVEGAGE